MAVLILIRIKRLVQKKSEVGIADVTSLDLSKNQETISASVSVQNKVKPHVALLASVDDFFNRSPKKLICLFEAVQCLFSTRA
jgi:hypothetical protein